MDSNNMNDKYLRGVNNMIKIYGRKSVRQALYYDDWELEDILNNKLKLSHYKYRTMLQTLRDWG